MAHMIQSDHYIKKKCFPRTECLQAPLADSQEKVYTPLKDWYKIVTRVSVTSVPSACDLHLYQSQVTPGTSSIVIKTLFSFH